MTTTPTPFRHVHVTSSDSASNLLSMVSATGLPPKKPPTPPKRPETGTATTTTASRPQQQQQPPIYPATKTPTPKRDKPRVLVVLTGGTMAMRATGPRGALEPAAGYLASKMRSMGELRDAKMPAYEVIEYDPLLDSADMVPGDWSTIARDIAERHDDFDGFVVILGTDTMAFCASALAFMLENLQKPVVLTGSMVPLCEAYSDARRNLVMSLIFAAGLKSGGDRHHTPPEVLVFFHDRLLRGCRASKVDALGLKAFDSPNFPPLATVGVAVNDNFAAAYNNHPGKKKKNNPRRGDTSANSSSQVGDDDDDDDEGLRDGGAASSSKTKCRARLEMDTRIVVIRVVPGFDDSALAACFSSESLRAVVLELYGTGTAPSRRQHLVDALKVARENHVLVVATTQCRRGGVVMSTYAVGQALLDVGVVSSGDMTTEAAATKLAYLFGKYPGDPARVRRCFVTNLRGEMSSTEVYTRPFFEDDLHGGETPSLAVLPDCGGDVDDDDDGHQACFSSSEGVVAVSSSSGGGCQNETSNGPSGRSGVSPPPEA